MFKYFVSYNYYSQNFLSLLTSTKPITKFNSMRTKMLKVLYAFYPFIKITN